MSRCKCVVGARLCTEQQKWGWQNSVAKLHTMDNPSCSNMDASTVDCLLDVLLERVFTFLDGGSRLAHNLRLALFTTHATSTGLHQNSVANAGAPLSTPPPSCSPACTSMNQTKFQVCYVGCVHTPATPSAPSTCTATSHYAMLGRKCTPSWRPSSRANCRSWWPT